MEHHFYAEIVWTSQHGTQNIKTPNRTTHKTNCSFLSLFVSLRGNEMVLDI